MSVDQVVELLSKGEGLTTDHIAAKLNIVEKTDAARLMGNLKRAGTVVKKGDKWVLGPLVKPKTKPSKASKVPAKSEPSQAARDAVSVLEADHPATAEQLKKWRASSGETVAVLKEPPPIDKNTESPLLELKIVRELASLEHILKRPVPAIPPIHDHFTKTETLKRLAALMDPTISSVLLDIVKDLQRFDTLSKEVADATGS